MSYKQSAAGALQTNVNQITLDYTIMDNDTYGAIMCNYTSTSKSIKVTLPTLADNQGRLIYIKNIANGLTVVEPEGSELIDNSTYQNLYSDFDNIEIIAGSTSWLITKMNSIMKTGLYNRTDFSNVKLGNIVINTTGVLTNYVLGEIISSTASVTGKILEKGSTYLILYDVTGIGNFTTSQLLTGANSGQNTAIAQIATININTDITHKFNTNIDRLQALIILSSNSTYTNSFIINFSVGDSNYGLGLFQNNMNSLYVWTASGGVNYIPITGGAAFTIDTETYYTECIVKKII